LRSLDVVDVNCLGYRLKGQQAFSIKDGFVNVIMEKDEPPPPPPLFEYPQVLDTELPNKEEVLTHMPAVKPDEVLLECSNETADKLTLCMLDCYQHFARDTSGMELWPIWTVLTIGPRRTVRFDRFAGGTGVFRIYVRDTANQTFLLGTYELFESSNPKLVIR